VPKGSIEGIQRFPLPSLYPQQRGHNRAPHRNIVLDSWRR
jgi:hypothetical protein